MSTATSTRRKGLDAIYFQLFNMIHYGGVNEKDLSDLLRKET